jgi:hypothetical protein
VTIELLSVPTETSQTATTTTQTVLTRQAHTDHPSFTCFAFDLPEQKHQSLTELYRFTVESTRGYSLGLAVCAANKFELVSETPAVVENAAEPASEPSSEEHQEADPNADVTQEIKHVFMPSLIPLSQITSFDLSVDPTIAAANALSSTPHALNSVVHLVENTSKTWSELGIVLKESSGMMQSSLVNLCAAMHKVTFKIDSKNGEPAPGMYLMLLD